MKDRIKDIMDSQHLSQGAFANFIGVSPASLSSIFNGRTRPTLNIIEAIKDKIPNISTDWLMFGTGSMYIDNSDSTSYPSVEPALDFISSSTAPLSSNSVVQQSKSVEETPKNIEKTVVKYIDKEPRKITEIRIFYDDQTWETFVSKK